MNPTEQQHPSEPRHVPPSEHGHVPHFEEGEEAPPPGVGVMSLVRWILVIAMAVAAGASLYYVLGTDQVESGIHDHEHTQYYCPMHPQIVQDEPGTCPICHMKLVPRAVAPAAAPTRDPALPKDVSTVDLSPERTQLIGMRTAKVTRGTLGGTVRSVGVIAPTEGGITSVQTRYSGWVEELHVAESGQPVAKGQLLARMYSPELLAAQQELINARSWSGLGGADGGAPGAGLLAQARKRLELMGMHPDEVAAVERTGEARQLIAVRSPARGYVAEKQAVLGVYVQPGTQLFQIADLTRVWALIDVLERDVGRIEVGQPATLTLTAYPGEKFEGKVELVYPLLDAATRTLRVRVTFKNPKLKLKPGMFGDVTLAVSEVEGLLIPREALVDTGIHRYVFVETEPGRFTPRPVEVGARGDHMVQIVSGLREGETVVTTGNFLLDSESRLGSAIEAH